jgi:cytolysin (calcineurin-like family phosphatase)
VSLAASQETANCLVGLVAGADVISDRRPRIFAYVTILTHVLIRMDPLAVDDQPPIHVPR